MGASIGRTLYVNKLQQDIEANERSIYTCEIHSRKRHQIKYNYSINIINQQVLRIGFALHK